MTHPPSSNDWVVLIRCSTPTEAFILKGVLDSANLACHVADNHLIQANNWMTNALGGVRVLVLQSEIEEAQSVLRDYQHGLLNVDEEIEDEKPKHFSEIPHPIYSPDFSGYLSFFLTPVFGTSIQLYNSIKLHETQCVKRRLIWVIVSVLATAAVVYHLVVTQEIGEFLFFRASATLSVVTAIWYFIEGNKQEKYIVEKYGAKYAHKSLPFLVVIVMAGFYFSAWFLQEIQ